MSWNGNRLAQEQADAAWNAVKDRCKKKKSGGQQGKSRRNLRLVTPKYFDYINSPAWARKRRKAFKHHGSSANGQSSHCNPKA